MRNLYNISMVIGSLSFIGLIISMFLMVWVDGVFWCKMMLTLLLTFFLCLVVDGVIDDEYKN